LHSARVPSVLFDGAGGKMARKKERMYWPPAKFEPCFL
jgi:hypothetical protein